MIHPASRPAYLFVAGSALLLLLLGAAACAQQPPAAASQPYTWKNVVIRGGGFVDGIIFSTTQKGLVYARTDVGGAYRSDNSGERWIPITDFIDRKNSSFTGIESLALDPNDSNKVYAAAGLYSAEWGGPSAIMRSSNRGRTWQGTIMPFKMGGNDDGRNCGEKLAVDPNLGSILFFGSRRAGLWQSSDSGVKWTHVDSFPIKDLVPGPWQKVGITFVLFDRGSGAKGTATPGIYVGVAQAPDANASNLYHSTDGGATWTATPGTPKSMFPSHAVMSPSGQMLFTFINSIGPNDISDGAIMKFSPAANKWENISPVQPGADGGRKFGFGGISLDLENPNTIMVTTLDRWGPADSIFRTTDAGKHWKEITLDSAVFSANSVPWVYWHKDRTGGTGWMNEIAIDPFNSDKVMYTTGEGIWGSADVTASDHGKTTHWGFPDEGLEETVPIALVSPPEGAHLISGVGDIGGFRHDDLDKSPADGFFTNPQFNNTDSLDFATQKPLTVVRVGRGDKNIVHGAWSSDGGAKWTPFGAEAPTSKWGSGHVALAPDASVIVWTPERGNAYRSSDMGKSWTACAGLPDQAHVISDRIDPKRFYSFDPATGKLLRSTDGALTFSAASETPVAPPKKDFFLISAPDASGDLWLSIGDKAFRSTDFGSTFAPVVTLAKVYSIGFGKAAPGASYSSIYVVGADSNADGFFRSDDTGKTWVRMDDPSHQFGWIRTLTGDPRVYGRVYLATGGRGIIYGDIRQQGSSATGANAVK